MHKGEIFGFGACEREGLGMSIRSDLLRVSEEHWGNSEVFFRRIETEEDLIYAGYDCRLREEQADLVNPFWFSIGRAYLAPEDHVPCVICTAAGERIGFIDFYQWRGDPHGYAWGYFIDARQQGKGYGKAAARLAVRLLKAAAPTMPICLAVAPENHKAQALYRSLGFHRRSALDGDDLVFCL